MDVTEEDETLLITSVHGKVEGGSNRREEFASRPRCVCHSPLWGLSLSLLG